MERSRVYLFSRLTHLIRVIEFLYEEGGELSFIDQIEPGWKHSAEGVAAHLARRTAYLPTQIDGTFKEIARIVDSLSELNRVAIRVTGSLSEPGPHIPVTRPKTPAPPPLVDRATNRPFANQADVEPTRARPPIQHAKSHADIRAGGGHPAFRRSPETKGKQSYKDLFPR